MNRSLRREYIGPVSSINSLGKSFRAVDPLLTSQVKKCLKWKGNQEGDHELMVEALRQLAVTGFIPIDDYDDPIASVISANSVGGVVMEGSPIIGLPD